MKEWQYHELNSTNYFWCQIYLFLFIAMSILVIQNVFIAIIQDGYEITKHKEKKDWVKHRSQENSLEASFVPDQEANEPNEPKSPTKISLRKNQVVSQANPYAKFKKTCK